MRRTTLAIAIGLLGGSLFLSGCATTITKPAAPPQPSKERFGSFGTVEFENVTLAPKYKAAAANQKAAKKINEELIAGLQNVFPGMKVVDQATSPAKDKTLVIRPVIQEIKFIGGAARFWVGPMAGSSAVLMHVDYVDMSTGAILANPQFYRASNAWGGGMTMGGADNMMLSTVAQDIVTYSVSNR